MKTQLSAIAILILLVTSNVFSQTPGWKWGRLGIGNDYDLGNAVAADANGNAIVVGYLNSDSITFGAITLYNTVPGNRDVVVVKYDSSGNVLWAKAHGGSGDDAAKAVATDAAGNVYVTGDFYSDTITFGSFNLISTDATSDIFVVKYDPMGNVLWAKKEGGIAVDMPYDIAVDALGNAIVVGRFSSTQIIFGSDTLIMQGSMDAFVVKYNPSGNAVWARGAGSGSNDEAYSVDMDAAGNVYVGGYFNQHAIFDTITLTSEGQADIFLAKYNSSGDIQWAKGVGADGDDRADAVSVDASGNVYVAGFYDNDTIAFGSIPLPQESGDNSFFAKYTPAGNVVWAKAMHGKSQSFGMAVTGNSVFICGKYSADTLTYDLFNLFLLGSTDLFLLKCDTAGNTKWLTKQTDGGESTDVAYSVAADPSGNIFIEGNFGSHEPLIFGSDVLDPTDNSYDIFVARLGHQIVGIEDLENDNAIVIYPNPSDGEFILEGIVTFRKLEVYDVTGLKVCSLDYTGREINLSQLHEGIYFLKMLQGEKKVCRKIIVQRD